MEQIETILAAFADFMWGMPLVVLLVGGVYATMAIPTMLSTIILVPRVREVARDYCQRLHAREFDFKKAKEPGRTN